MADLALDAVLAVLVVALAARCLNARDPVTAALTFVAFGLALALAWARLGAPDVALAEAALGAGITGFLLLDAARALRSRGAPAARGPVPVRRHVAGVLAGGAVAGVLGVALLDLPGAAGPTATAVEEALPAAGASHPVTAVLLDLRAYDTWLEVCVVLAACVGALAARGRADAADRTPPPADPMLAWMTALVAPAGLVAGGALLWLGTGAPGGAFQAGSVLGATMLLLWLAGRPAAAAPTGWRLTAPLAAGGLAFAALAAGTLLAGRTLLDLPGRGAGELIVAVEAAVTVAVAASLVLLVLAAAPARPRTAPAGRPGGGAGDAAVPAERVAA